MANPDDVNVPEVSSPSGRQPYSVHSSPLIGAKLKALFQLMYRVECIH